MINGKIKLDKPTKVISIHKQKDSPFRYNWHQVQCENGMILEHDSNNSRPVQVGGLIYQIYVRDQTKYTTN